MQVAELSPVPAASDDNTVRLGSLRARTATRSHSDRLNVGRPLSGQELSRCLPLQAPKTVQITSESVVRYVIIERETAVPDSVDQFLGSVALDLALRASGTVPHGQRGAASSMWLLTMCSAILVLASTATSRLSAIASIRTVGR